MTVSKLNKLLNLFTATETATEERVGILMKILTMLLLHLTVIAVIVMAVRLMTMEPPMDLLKQPRTSFCASSIISAVTSMNSYVKKKLPLSFQNTMMINWCTV